jgi:hypothetical protein
MTELEIEEAIREAWEIFQAGTTASPAARPALCHNGLFIAKFGAEPCGTAFFQESDGPG